MIALLKNTVFFVFVVCSMPLFAQVQPGAYQTQKYLPLMVDMRVAVVGNQSSQILKNDKRIHLVDHLRSQGVNIKKVFAPEHGFRGKEDAGASIEDEIDALSLRINETKISSPPSSSPIPIVSEEEVPNEMDSIKLECPICYCELNTDVDSDDYTGCCVGQYCGHALCESCWNEYRRLRNKVCPVCRKLLYIGRGRPPKANVF